MSELQEQRVLDESPVEKSGNQELLVSIGASPDSVPELFVVFVVVVGGVFVAAFWLLKQKNIWKKHINFVEDVWHSSEMLS